jgi:DNA-binding transcriptional LysR family regulator
VDLDQVNAFLVLCEELHFGRTAERLYLSQPRVSRLVSSFETEIGGSLFERTSRRVRLTPLGERLRDQLQPAYTAMQLAVQAARREAQEAAGLLRVGFTTTTEGPVFSRLIKEFRARQRDCEITLHEVDLFDPYSALRRGEIDVLCHYLHLDEPDLTTGPELARYDVVLAVARGHRLARSTAVGIEDVADEELPRLPSTFPLEISRFWLPRRPAGPQVRTYKEILSLVAQGKIVWAGIDFVLGQDRDDLVTVPMRDMGPVRLGLIWCSARENARTRALASVADSMQDQGSVVGPAAGNAPR